MITFAERVDNALDAVTDNDGFFYSRAQKEEALQPVVDVLLGMDYVAMTRYVNESFRGAGSHDSLVVDMVRERLATSSLDSAITEHYTDRANSGLASRAR